MLWRKKVPETDQKMPTIMEVVQAKAQRWDKVQRWVCVFICKHYDLCRSSYPETNSKCDTCELNIQVARELEEAGLLGVVHKKEQLDE